jgi:hypothetical protein
MRIGAGVTVSSVVSVRPFQAASAAASIVMLVF